MTLISVVLQENSELDLTVVLCLAPSGNGSIRMKQYLNYQYQDTLYPCHVNVSWWQFWRCPVAKAMLDAARRYNRIVAANGAAVKQTAEMQQLATGIASVFKEVTGE